MCSACGLHKQRQNQAQFNKGNFLFSLITYYRVDVLILSQTTNIFNINIGCDDDHKLHNDFTNVSSKKKRNITMK